MPELSAENVRSYIRSCAPPELERTRASLFTVRQPPHLVYTTEITAALNHLIRERNVLIVEPIAGSLAMRSTDLPILIATAIANEYNKFPSDPTLVHEAYRAFIHTRATAIRPPSQELDVEAYAYEVEQNAIAASTWLERWQSFMDNAARTATDITKSSRTLIIVPLGGMDPVTLRVVIPGLIGHPNLIYLIDTTGEMPVVRRDFVRGTRYHPTVPSYTDRALGGEPEEDSSDNAHFSLRDIEQEYQPQNPSQGGPLDYTDLLRPAPAPKKAQPSSGDLAPPDAWQRLLEDD